MLVNEKPMEYVKASEGSEVFEALINEKFQEVATKHSRLYTVKADDLWGVYLDNMPEENKFVYDCRNCRRFVERYGNLVVIDENGEVKSALWNVEQVPPQYEKAIKAMNDCVKAAAKVNGVFISDVQTLGTPVTGVWTHLNAVLPIEMVNRSRVKNAEQLMAEKKQDFITLCNALQEYPMEVAEQAVALLQTNAMYRSERVLGVAEWFLNLHVTLQSHAVNGVQRTNLIWKAAGEAPVGYCHVKASMIGTLLDDISKGKATQAIMAAFEHKMNPRNYGVAKAAPTVPAIVQAEKMVEKLGIADSLRRRYARFDEIADHMLWMPKVLSNKETPNTSVFGHLIAARNRSAQRGTMELPVTTMTWEKFCRTILPDVARMEAKVEHPDRFMALVTEAVLGAERIFQWRNPFSWYYPEGIDGEIKRRVEAAGGTYENCEIRCSLIWENFSDLDIHCYTPFGNHIFWNNRRTMIDGGMLDVDKNGLDDRTDEPVENIRWIDNAPNGRYRFVVHNYTDRNMGDNPYKAELSVGGKVYTFHGCMCQEKQQTTVFSFDYNRGVVTNLVCGGQKRDVNSDMWGLTGGSFVEVKGIVNSPNMWDEDSHNTSGSHTFFILEGCKDAGAGVGRGFINETLKSELREFRKTLQAYVNEKEIEGVEDADACGIGFEANGEWNVVLRVTLENGNKRLIKIDRFD